LNNIIYKTEKKNNLMRGKEILRMIAEGESLHTEFERDVTLTTPAKICSIANRGGGLLLIGVSDDGKVVGCNYRKCAPRITASLKSITPLPKISVEKLRIDGRDIVLVRVGKSRRLCSIGGVSYIRLGPVLPSQVS
jgi:ATP-dependent DNA helicase RecG